MTRLNLTPAALPVLAIFLAGAGPLDTPNIPPHSFGGRLVGGPAPFYPSGNRAPIYPPEYQGSGKIGMVVVDCVIQTDGKPKFCHVFSVRGGQPFATEALRWLRGNNGPVYAPIIKDGKAQPGRRKWAISFQPPE